MLVHDSERLRTAAARFVAFFRELSETYIEREDLLQQIALSLLSREHTLMTGPPGTAKSSLAHSVLGRIVSERTGEPSLFARQFTESTVQTDLVGPIDFKTLMETGRTEHFTDEGMLGAVHAFLDEVFDGRDMLLRSTLNVLQERELKQGTRTTRGKIECALMTTNRYLAEILETSSETLLAFVDRIAFVSFVPRGFSDATGLGRVLRIQVAGTKPPPLSAPLTIEDLDALQDATDSVFVSEHLTDQLAAFVASFEIEMDAARRADPTFVPTRYLSTRSIVRLGRMLRAICIYDWAFNGRLRELVAQQTDFWVLRLGLLLSGPSLEQIAALLRTEVDPREQRQLSIMRAEREIFDRCLAQLPPARSESALPPVSAEVLSRSTPDELAGRENAELLDLARELASVATSGRRGATEAAARFQGVVRELSVRAFRSGLGGAAGDNEASVPTLQALAALADDIEEADGGRAAVARWLRSRVLESVDRAMELGPTALGADLARLVHPPSSPAEILTAAESLLRRPRDLVTLRARLRSRGAQEADPEAGAKRWKRALGRVLDELVAVWGDGLRTAGGEALAAIPSHELTRFMAAMAELLQRLRESAAALGELGGDADALVARVVGPRIRPYVEAAFERFDATDRWGVAKQVAVVFSVLESAGLSSSVAPCDLVAWSAEALLRTETAPKAADPVTDYDGYRTIRESTPRVSLTYTLVDILLCVVPELGEAMRAPASAVDRLGELLQDIPVPVRRELVMRDVARIDRALSALESWFAGLSTALPSDPGEALMRLASSRFYTITRDESALTRFALEAKLVHDVFPEADIGPLLGRVEDLEQRSWELVRRTVADRTERDWADTLEAWKAS